MRAASAKVRVVDSRIAENWSSQPGPISRMAATTAATPTTTAAAPATYHQRRRRSGAATGPAASVPAMVRDGSTTRSPGWSFSTFGAAGAGVATRRPGVLVRRGRRSRSGLAAARRGAGRFAAASSASGVTSAGAGASRFAARRDGGRWATRLPGVRGEDTGRGYPERCRRLASEGLVARASARTCCVRTAVCTPGSGPASTSSAPFGSLTIECPV